MASDSAIGGKTQRAMVRPMSILETLQSSKSRVVVWLQHDTVTRIEGQLLGVDEWMNLVLDDAVEINTKANKSFPLGRTLLKADNIGLVHSVA